MKERTGGIYDKQETEKGNAKREDRRLNCNKRSHTFRNASTFPDCLLPTYIFHPLASRSEVASGKIPRFDYIRREKRPSTISLVWRRICRFER